MNPKKKKCKTCPDITYIFSKGECKRCAQIRYARNAQEKQKAKILANPAQIKRKQLTSKPTKRHTENKDAELKAMLEFWSEHENFEGRCQCSECGVSLEFDRSHCAHILGKGAWPQYRTELINLIILCFECHQEFDFGERSKMKVAAHCEEIEMQLKKAA